MWYQIDFLWWPFHHFPTPPRQWPAWFAVPWACWRLRPGDDVAMLPWSRHPMKSWNPMISNNDIEQHVYLIGGILTPLKNIWVRQSGLLFPLYGKKCSKPPTKYIDTYRSKFVYKEQRSCSVFLRTPWGACLWSFHQRLRPTTNRLKMCAICIHDSYDIYI